MVSVTPDPNDTRRPLGGAPRPQAMEGGSLPPQRPLTPLQPVRPQSPPQTAMDEVAGQMELERQQRIEYLRSVAKKPHKEKRSKAWLWILLVLVVLAGGGAAGWRFFLRDKPVAKPAATATTQQIQPKADTKPVMKHYASSNFSLEFDYPENWTVTDSGGNALTVTSPVMQQKTAAGSSQNGKITMTIQGSSDQLNEFKAGNATAVIDSQKITYTKPSSTQRAETYLSFLRLASSANTGLDEIYVTGDNGYQKGQAIPQVDIAKGNPHISVAFLPCTGSSCSATNPLPVTLSSDIWQDKTFATPITMMLESLSVQ